VAPRLTIGHTPHACTLAPGRCADAAGLRPSLRIDVSSATLDFGRQSRTSLFVVVALRASPFAVSRTRRCTPMSTHAPELQRKRHRQDQSAIEDSRCRRRACAGSTHSTEAGSRSHMSYISKMNGRRFQQERPSYSSVGVEPDLKRCRQYDCPRRHGRHDIGEDRCSTLLQRAGPT